MTILSWLAANVFLATAAFNRPSNSNKQAILCAQGSDQFMATAWIVLKSPTESALNINLSIQSELGSLPKILSIDLLGVTVLANEAFIIFCATTLLLTSDEDAPDKPVKSAFGQPPSANTPPDAILDPNPEAAITAPVPTLDNPVAEDRPVAPV